MANAPVVVIGISFCDRGANVAKMTFYVPWTVAIADVFMLADILMASLTPISDAVISKLEILFRWRADSPPAPASSSNVERKVLLLLTNDDLDINGIIIPSPADIFEITGDYAGIRVDLASSAIAAFQAALAELDYRTDDDRQLGQVVAAGGLAL